jgi:hypothetical protein
LFTENGGVNFTNYGMADSTLGAMLSVRTAGPTWGIAGGLGFLGLPCGAYTPDGANWYNLPITGISLLCAFQGAAAADDGTGVLIGSWSGTGDWEGNGIKITTDKGTTWNQINGDMGNIPARYGSFLNKNLGYITGGTWAAEFLAKETSVDRLLANFPLTRHISFDLLSKRYRIERPARSADVTGYAALLSEVTNAGQNWTLLVNITDGGLYFNEISCVDQNNCWATLEGIDKTGSDTASIFHTSNGWATYDVQLTVPGGPLVAIDMYSATVGWATGALVQGDVTGDFDGQFWQTLDGKTWTLVTSIKNFYPFDVSTVDANNAYAAGITPIGLSSFASYHA